MISYQKPFIGDIIPHISYKRVIREERNELVDTLLRLKKIIKPMTISNSIAVKVEQEHLEKREVVEVDLKNILREYSLQFDFGGKRFLIECENDIKVQVYYQKQNGADDFDWEYLDTTKVNLQ